MTTEDLIKEIDDLIAANKPVSAIKRLRELFPEYNLKEAHDHIRFGWEEFKRNWRA